MQGHAEIWKAIPIIAVWQRLQLQRQLLVMTASLLGPYWMLVGIPCICQLDFGIIHSRV